MKTTPTAEVIRAQFQMIDRLKRGPTTQQDTKPAVTTTGEAVPTKADAREVKQATVEINQALKSLNDHLQFSVDAATETTVVRLIDGDTGEVIRQVPPEEILRLRAYYREHQGLLLNTAV